MYCTRFIGETLVDAFWLHKLLATSTLMSLLMKAGLSLNVFWQGTSKPLLHLDLSSFMFKTLWTVLCIYLAQKLQNRVTCNLVPVHS